MSHTPRFLSFAGYTIGSDKILYVSPVRASKVDPKWTIVISLQEGHFIEESYPKPELAHDARTIIDATLFGLVSEDEPEVATPEAAPKDWTKATAQEVADEINRRYGLEENGKVMFNGRDCNGKAYVDEEWRVKIESPERIYPWVVRSSDGEFTNPFQSILS